MTAAARPEPDDDPAPDAEGLALLEAMRRRLDDQVALQRKTAAQVGQLADSIAALVDAQRRRSRWLNLNSFVAYVMFTVLCGGAFYFVYAARAREVTASRDRAIADRDAAVHRANDLAAQLAARDAELAAKAAAPAAALATAPAPSDPVATAEAALAAGHDRDVIQALEPVLAHAPRDPRAPQMHYLLGVAHAHAGELGPAIRDLQLAAATDTKHDDVQFQLASALDRAGQWAAARASYQRFAAAHPHAASAAFALRRVQSLSQRPAPAPKPAAVPATAAGSAAAAPAAGSATPAAPAP